MKNKLSDLTNHLYAQLERLNDETLSKEDIDAECKRVEAMSKIANNIISATQTTVNAAKLIAGKHVNRNDIPMIESN